MIILFSRPLTATYGLKFPGCVVRVSVEVVFAGGPTSKARDNIIEIELFFLNFKVDTQI